MKKRDKENLKTMKVSELEKRLHDLQVEVQGIRFKTEGSKSKNVKETWAKKKEIARVLTFINQSKQDAR